jgi:hypothetical protein
MLPIKTNAVFLHCAVPAIAGTLLLAVIVAGCGTTTSSAGAGADVTAAPAAPATTLKAAAAPRELRGVYVAGAKPAARQSTPACENDSCPGLGSGFYLPSTNALSVLTGGRVFFARTKLGECATLSTIASASDSLSSVDSMQQFVENTSADLDVGGDYKTSTLTVQGTAQVMTGSSSDITTAFHSVTLDVTTLTGAVDFKQDATCFAASNIAPEYLKDFEALALIAEDQVGNAASWDGYVQFLKTNGSHIMMQQQLGSRFQQWESSTSTTSSIARTLSAKACADVEGLGTGEAGSTGWSVSTCASYSKEEREKAQKETADSTKIIDGGTAKTRAELKQGVTKARLGAFIGSAESADQAVAYTFKPIWELLDSIYASACAAGGKGSAACANVQRARNLQAAYEGWTAVSCPELKSGSLVYQTMAIEGTSSLGINTYKCTAAKTGCRASGDCHLGGALGGVCYCYGNTCLDTGKKVSGTDQSRTEVRGKQSGSYDKGVNNSCYYKASVHCACQNGWAGGLPERNLYLQSGSY